MFIIYALAGLLSVGFLWYFVEERAKNLRFFDNVMIMGKMERMSQEEIFDLVKKNDEDSKSYEEFKKIHPVKAKIKEWREYYYI